MLIIIIIIVSKNHIIVKSEYWTFAPSLKQLSVEIEVLRGITVNGHKSYNYAGSI